MKIRRVQSLFGVGSKSLYSNVFAGVAFDDSKFYIIQVPLFRHICPINRHIFALKQKVYSYFFQCFFVPWQTQGMQHDRRSFKNRGQGGFVRLLRQELVEGIIIHFYNNNNNSNT